MSKSLLPKLKTGDSTFDKIYAYFVDEQNHSLSPKHEKIKDRWLSIWTLQLNFHSTEQAITAHRNLFKDENDELLSRSQAFRDLSSANKIFGSLFKTTRDAKRAIYSEYVHKFYLQTIKSKDLKAQGKALELLGKAWQIDLQEDQKFNPEKFENPQIKVGIPTKFIDAVVDHLNKGVIDFNKLDVEDIEHEEV